MKNVKKNRSHMLQIRVSPAELRSLRAVAKLRMLGVSELVRAKLGKSLVYKTSNAGVSK